jgi:DNA-binding PadR family transcriptional regulator
MAVTRLLVLGAVRIFQPTHGYFVRRELASWQVEEWAHLNPGSVYNALRGLTKEGLLAEEPETARSTARKHRRTRSYASAGPLSP